MRSAARALRGHLKGPLRWGPVRRVALGAGAARGHALTLLFHRVAPQDPQAHEVVRSVPLALFRRQLEVLTEVGDVVPAAELAARPAAGRRPRFALTFDDDYASQRTACRILAEMGLPGTFFLSGRALHGLGAYWWEVIEHRVAREGLQAVAATLGVDAATPAQLAAACEATPLASRLTAEATGVPWRHLTTEDIAAIAATPGMTVGFHTVHHPVLPTLADDEMADALRFGRTALAHRLGRDVDLLAYPHGKATPAVASEAAAAGYRFAWTGRVEPTRRGSDPHLLGRWEPHGLEPLDFLTQLAIRLNLADILR